MASESKEVDPQITDEAAEEAVAEVAQNADSSSSDDEGEEEGNQTGVPAEADTVARGKKKKSKKDKFKQLLRSGPKEGEASASSSSSASKLTPEMMQQLLEMNPSLKGELAGLDKVKAAEALKSLDAAALMTGMSINGKNQKDMASYKFWQTQPVSRFDDGKDVQEGPIKTIDPAQVPKEPRALYDGFEWVTVDILNENELTEVYELLTGHYVEDNDSTFRLNYSASFLNWALRAPGWRKDWHVGVRAAKSKKLVAFISAIPVHLNVRGNVFKSSEVNFLCIHKKLRSKRLAPVLIEEITRRNYVVGVYQAIYTAGTLLPKPFSSCRYYHRPLDWLKLYECDFSPMPKGSTKQRQIIKNHVPSNAAVPGFRPMCKEDVAQVADLFKRYLERFAIRPEFSPEEVEHWFLHDEKLQPEQVVWTHVVENPESHKITDFTSFYKLDSGLVKPQKHATVHAAYCFYYGTEAAFAKDEKGLKLRLNAIMLDTLVMAKKANFDVFNALTLLDNPLFLEQQKFGRGDGQLHYYLYNYRTAPIPGGVDAKNEADERQRGGVGVVML